MTALDTDPLGHIPNPYRQGFLARERGKGIGFCRYVPFTENNQLWKEGWRDCDAGRAVEARWVEHDPRSILIERQAAEIARLREALRRIKREDQSSELCFDIGKGGLRTKTTLGPFAKIARAALKETAPEGGEG